jgi:antitoxin ParD1/3/4
MNVSLTPELEQLVRQKVDSGRYLSASEVVREGLRLLEERDHLYQIRLAQLQKELDPAIQEADRGELLDGEAVFAELYAELDQAGQR